MCKVFTLPNVSRLQRITGSWVSKKPATSFIKRTRDNVQKQRGWELVVHHAAQADDVNPGNQVHQRRRQAHEDAGRPPVAQLICIHRCIWVPDASLHPDLHFPRGSTWAPRGETACKGHIYLVLPSTLFYAEPALHSRATKCSFATRLWQVIQYCVTGKSKECLSCPDPTHGASPGEAVAAFAAYAEESLRLSIMVGFSRLQTDLLSTGYGMQATVCSVSGMGKHLAVGPCAGLSCPLAQRHCWMPRCRAAAAAAEADVKALHETRCRLYWPQPRTVASMHLCPLSFGPC